MRFKLATLLFLVSAILVVSSETDNDKEEDDDDKLEEVSNSREKRQQIAFYPRRGPRPPPYAVQMEPIVQYSQRDPLYNPLASAKKSDDSLYAEEAPRSYYQSEPEPIIEIIIKESNESLPTPVPPPPPPSRPAKEPIQVFYVKYEKKHGPGDEKSRVVYDTPIPALTPVEEHEEIHPDNPAPHHDEFQGPTSPSPPPEPSTTLRTVIRPDSEVYHAGSSGIRVTFGTEQVPPNQHNKRSDREQDRPPGLPKRQHGPYQPQFQAPIFPIQRQQPIQRFPPALGQQRVVNSFAPPAIPSLNQQQGPTVFQQQQSQIRPLASIPPVARPQRPAITIQGLPDPQQRVTFNSFNSQQLRINPPVTLSRQNLQTASRSNAFNVDHNQQQQQQQQTFKQQEIEKQRYYEQRRQQDLIRQREQLRVQEQQRRQQEIEQKQIQEQQRRQQEIEQKRIQEQQRKQQEIEQKQIQEQQYRQQLKFNQQQQQYREQISQAQFQRQQQQLSPSDRPGGEILKAVPKLEQHYAIRENPLHPGPFPPNPQPVQQFHPSQQVNLGQDRGQLQLQQHFTRHRQASPFGGENQQQIYSSQNFAAASNLQQQQIGVPSSSSPPIGESKSIWGRPVFPSPSASPSASGGKIYATPVSNFGDIQVPTTARSPTTSSYRPPTTTAAPSTTESEEEPTTVSPKNEAKIKQNIANLPDEVPDDIRQQLLSSGILGNADIQILDYDKVGDIPIENLPPEALANFYGAGGASAAASEPVPAIVKRPKIDVKLTGSKKSPKVEQATLRPGGVEMKVVHFDPNTAQGQAIADHHIREDATHLDPVKIGPKDNAKYNRYLPLKVSGAAFPLPDVPELNGRKITSVVVLAPVDYNFQGEREQRSSSDADDSPAQNPSRQGRKLNDVQAVRFLAGEALKQVVQKPSAENYKKWLEQESRADPQRQSVVLLVTTPSDDNQGEKEIFMYDVTTQAVSKLAGDLSTAFVDVAESNSGNEDVHVDLQGASSIN